MIQRLAHQFVLYGDILFKWSPNKVWLRCLDAMEAQQTIKDVHGGICGPHMNGHMLAKKLGLLLVHHGVRLLQARREIPPLSDLRRQQDQRTTKRAA